MLNMPFHPYIPHPDLVCSSCNLLLRMISSVSFMKRMSLDDENGNNTIEGTNAFAINDIARERTTAIWVVAEPTDCRIQSQKMRQKRWKVRNSQARLSPLELTNRPPREPEGPPLWNVPPWLGSKSMKREPMKFWQPVSE